MSPLRYIAFCARSLVVGLLLFNVLYTTSQFNAALAQYVVSPPRVFVQEQPKKNFGTTSIQVTNPTNETLRLKAYVKNWAMAPSGELQPAAMDEATGIEAYTRISPKEFEVPPQGIQTLRIAVALPAEKEAGEYHGLLYLENIKTDLQQQEIRNGASMAITLTYRSGIGVYYTKGNTQIDLKIKHMSITIDPDGKPKAHIEIENQGTHHARIQGALMISDPNKPNQPLHTFAIQAGSEILILPNATRTIDEAFTTEAPDTSLPTGHYKAELILKSSRSLPQFSKQFAIQPISAVQDFEWAPPQTSSSLLKNETH
jgi:P pilus assembly chaperone PapD